MGLLKFACNVVIPGRAFLRCLISLSMGHTKPYQHVKISSEARKDPQTWKLFLSAFNGKAIFQYDPWIPAECPALIHRCSRISGLWRHIFFGEGQQHGKLNQSPSSSSFPLWPAYIFGHHNCAINVLSFKLTTRL